MRLPGLKRARSSGQWLLGKLVRHAVILGYHRVAAAPGPYRLGVSPEHFAQQLAILARATRPLPLEELGTLLASGRLPKRTVVVTFDDGYADVLHEAKPLLARLGVPATVFVISGALGRELWWDRLDRIASTAPDLGRPRTLPIGESAVSWPPRGSDGSAAALRRTVYPVLRAMDQPTREAALDRLQQRLGVPSDGGAAPRVVTPEELHRLAEGDLVRIGAHTMTHPALSTLSAGRQQEEIAGARRELEAVLGRTVAGFSYPYGDMGTVAPAAVREAGYRYACQSRNAVAWRGTDPFALPRFWVPDWDGPRFTRWLERWLDD